MVMDNVMDSSSSQQSKNPERLRNLASNVKFSGGNNLLHWFVLDNSHPNDSGSGHYMNNFLLSMSNVPANVVNALNDDGFSALHLAVLKNNLTMVKELLSCLLNIDVDARIRDRDYRHRGNAALHLAVELGHLSIVRELLDKGADIDIKNGSSKTAISCAASLGHLDAMRLLVSEGADVNLGDGYGNPLFYAVQSKNLEAVEFLVRSGANVNFPNEGFNRLFYCIDSGNLAIIEFLVSNGADVNIQAASLRSQTPLHYAALFASVEFVEYLVRNGADVNARDDEGATPLYYAIRSSKLENAVFLLDHGADINDRDQSHETPIHCAVKTRNEEIYEFLTCSSVWERHDVVSEGNLEIVKLLIDQGADLSAIDEEGRTPLHDAVYGQDFKMVEFLSDRGEDPLAEDRWNPDYDAAYRRCAKIIRVLLDRGADVDAENEDGETPLDLARNQLCIDALQNVG